MGIPIEVARRLEGQAWAWAILILGIAAIAIWLIVGYIKH